MMKSGKILFLFLLIALLPAGCRRFQQKPPVILITLDTVRADHLSLYGYPRLTTPFLAKLAGRGLWARWRSMPILSGC